jgi:protein-S-isoprenylcysteine O-methyltransferase Ste14
MNFLPQFTFTWLNGFLLILGMLVLRFGIPALIRKQSLKEMDFFPPVEGIEKTMLKLYTVSNILLVLTPLFMRLEPATFIAIPGWTTYALGLLIIAFSMLNFSREETGLHTTGIYRLSRNPIYVGYFLIYIGVGLLIGSWCYLMLAVIYQFGCHFVILSEERWCEEMYGQKFLNYKQKVRRYL